MYEHSFLSSPFAYFLEKGAKNPVEAERKGQFHPLTRIDLCLPISNA